MHSIKTDLTVLGSTNLQNNLTVQGIAVFASSIQGLDVDFRNATFNNITAGGEIISPALSISGDINVGGDIIGSATSNATLHSLSTDSITASTLNSTDIISTGTINSNTIVNTNGLQTKSLTSTDSVSTAVVNTTDIVSTGTITSDTIINSNSVTTKDLTSTGVITGVNINTSSLTSTGSISGNSLTSATSVTTNTLSATSISTTSGTVTGTLTTKDINSSGTIASTTINNSGTITSSVLSGTTGNITNVNSANIVNTAGITTLDFTSTGTANTSSITNTGSISTLNLTSTGLVTANNLTTTGTLTSNNLTSTGTVTANIINASKVSSPDISTTGTITANAVNAGDITSTGTLHTANIINSAAISTDSMTVNTVAAESLTVAGNIVTGNIETNTVQAAFLSLGNTKTSAFSNNISWVMGDEIAVSPAWEGVSLDGDTVYPLTTKVYNALSDYFPLGPIGTVAVPCNTISTNQAARVVFKFEVTPAEDYTGVLQVYIQNEAHGNILIQYWKDVVIQTGVIFETIFDSPLWLSATESVVVQLIKENGDYLMVLSNDAGTAPYIKSQIRTFTNETVFNSSNIDLVVNELENLTGDNRLDVLNLKNIDQLEYGIFQGDINFGSPVTQFNGAIKGDYWIAQTAGTLDGVSFNVGDLLISKTRLTTVTTINDPALFIIETNPNPVATTTTPGIVIAGNGIAVDGTGHISTKLGLGITFDSGFNIIADVSNIDITQLKNYNSLQKGTFRGIIPATLSGLAGSVRGDFWKASSSGTIGTQSYNAGDELYCTVDTPTAPTDLTNFVYVPQTTSTMIGATGSAMGVGGIVPSPQAGDNSKALFGDATFKTVLMPSDVVDSLSSTSTSTPLSANQGSVLSALIATKSSTADIVDNLLSMSAILPLSANQGHVLKGMVDTKVNISDINDTLTSQSIVLPLSANQGYILNNKISLKLDKTDVLDTLTSQISSKALSANQGFVLKGLIDTKVNTSDIADNLTTTSATVPLSANQGAVLSALIATKADAGNVIDNLTSTSAVLPLSANQGRVLKSLVDAKVNISDINDTLTSTSVVIPLSANQGFILKGLVDSKINTSDVIDTLSSSSVVFPLSANQGRLLNIAIQTKVNTADIVDALNSTSTNTPLSANQGRILNNSIQTKLNVTDVVDSLTSTNAAVPLSANQGRVLKGQVDLKINISDINDTLVSTSTTTPLSANQGRVLNTAVSAKVNTADVIDTLTSNSVVFPLSANQGRLLNVAIGTKVNVSDIVNNLTSTSTVLPLSANQGNVLNTLIGTKQNTLVSGTNIKTINGNNLLGSGDIITNNDATALLKGVVQLAGDLGGTAAAPTVSKVNGITITGTPATGNILIATGTTAASWQAQTAMANATTSTSGHMSAADKTKLDSLIGGNFVGSTSSANGSAGQVPAPLIANSYTHMLKANGSWGGVNNAGRVSNYNLITQNATSTFANVVNSTALAVTGNTAIYTGTTAGIQCLLGGTYKVTITTHIATNGSVYGEASVGVGGTPTGAVYVTFAPAGLLTGNDRNTISFTELVTVTAGQVISLMFRSTNTNSTCSGSTIIVEKLD